MHLLQDVVGAQSEVGNQTLLVVLREVRRAHNQGSKRKILVKLTIQIKSLVPSDRVQVCGLTLAEYTVHIPC